MIPCMDFLAGAKYPDLVVRDLPDGWGIGIFTEKNLFGDAYPLLGHLLAKGKCPLVRLQLCWKDDHHFSHADFPHIIAEARRFVPLVVHYPNVEWQFSGACEHNLNLSDATELMYQVTSAIPQSCKYVNCPEVGHGVFIPNCINEVHGKNAHKPNITGDYNFSFDGSSSVDCDVTAIKMNCRDARAFFYWDAPYNLRYEDNDPTPRDQRTYKPSDKLIASVAYLNNIRGDVFLPHDFIWKSHAETKKPKPGQSIDHRADHPVLICPVHGNHADIKTHSGHLIASASRYPSDFVDGRARYYFNIWGYEMSKEAIRISGDPVCELWIDGKKYGTVNPAFREN